jgi:hypothetical protein
MPEGMREGQVLGSEGYSFQERELGLRVAGVRSQIIRDSFYQAKNLKIYLYSVGLKVMTKEILFDRPIHPHPHEIISARWFMPRAKVQAEIFLRFACGLLLGMGIALWFQWWR